MAASSEEPTRSSFAFASFASTPEDQHDVDQTFRMELSVLLRAGSLSHTSRTQVVASVACFSTAAPQGYPISSALLGKVESCHHFRHASPRDTDAGGRQKRSLAKCLRALFGRCELGAEVGDFLEGLLISLLGGLFDREKGSAADR